MDFLTEEELFELQHQDEMDAMDELDIENEIEFEHNFPKRKETEIKTPKATEEEKENIPVHIPSKRRLSFSDDEPKQIIDIADSQSIEDSSLYSQSLIQESAKRTLSQISDLSDDNSTYHSAKKTCRSYNETFENFLNESLRSQARPSFFAEVRNFSKDQQMITCIDGCRKYYSVKEEEDPNDLIPSFSQRTSSLLSIPIDVLKAQYFIMEEEELKRKEEELKRKKEEKVQTSSVISMDTDITEEKDAESSLWVEKYRPISYMHLLSEEGINRTLLQWLKLWDKVVFGKDKKAKKKAPVENKKPFPNPKFQTKYGELIEELDEHGRPHHKVAFLCGPPGLGKTTLAIIIAKHAGYNIVEINASDDRSPEVFRTNLEAATQMKAVLHEDKRPNCLILDEIDGAPAPSINVLLSFIKSTGIPKGKRKKGDIPLLMRPIICICNDQYSPALKPLRQIALVLNFPPTTTSRLTSRLNEICMRESLLADIAALTLLCEKTTNDIRSCLSTLQFIQRMKRDLKVSDLEGLTLGQKDIQKNLFQVWQDIFHCSEKPSFDAIYHTVNSFGDYDKIYIGIFENYANVKFKYRNANFVWDGADWLCFGDVVQREINHSQSFFLMSYLPYPPVAFHLLFASNAFPHIAYPAAFYEYKSRSIQLSNTMISLVKDIVSTMKCFLNSSLLLLDVFPFLVEIIKPTLRPVNTQLYSEREKSELRRVIELMLAFNLNYRQERLQDGTYTYVLDPNIEELIKFSNVKSSKVLTYSAKQMIAREVEMEQMRKGEAAVDLKIASQQEKKTTKPPVLNIEPVKKTTVTDRPVLDFFGRQITEDPNAKKKAKGDPRDEEVWFHFKEGYSNAVRKTIYVKDLL